ncbi:MAG: carboxypeptidase regulatory-like domain-containing protein [Deltaproteobacteria bacterium]|nr:carboxypeptidase regulatory-like domain-containing protein [Deltaproteobacteria bacterium]
MLLFPMVVQACVCEEVPEVPDGPAAAVASIFVEVQGVVRDAVTGLPIAEADVDIPAAGAAKRHLVTDERGFYSVRFEGFGSFLVFISADGYVDMRRTVVAALADAPEASFVIHVVNDVSMAPLTGAVSGVVVGTGPLDAVSGARVVVRLDPSLLAALDTSGVTLETTTDADGAFAFTGLPAGVALRLLVPAQDLDGDDLPDFATSLTQLGTLDEAPVVQNVAVTPFEIDEVVWTTFDNVESFAVQPEASFELVYAGPMSSTPGGTTVDLLRAGVRVATEHQWDADGIVLTVTPRAPLSVGQEYSITVTATTRNNDQVRWGPHVFLVGGDRLPGAVTNLALVGDAEDLGFVSPTFTVSFDAVDDATGYRVYARNDAEQSDWLQVASAAASALNPAAPEMSFALPAAFDSVPGTHTPFGFGETVEIAVVALIGENEGPFPTATLSVADVACPTLSVTRGGTFNNSGGSNEVALYFDVSAVGGEWLDPSTLPGVTFTDFAFPDGDGFLFGPGDFSVEIIDRDTLRLSALLPPGESAMLDRYLVDVSAVADPSGNLACDDAYPAPGMAGDGSYQSAVNAWDMEAALGWSGQSPWERGAPTSGPGAAYEGSSVWASNLAGDYPDTAAGTAVLSSGSLVLPTSSASVSYRIWHALGAGDTAALYWVQDGGTAQLLRQYLGSNGLWQSEAVSLSAYPAQTGHLELRLTVDGASTAGAGVYLDAMTFQGYWYLP